VADPDGASSQELAGASAFKFSNAEAAEAAAPPSAEVEREIERLKNDRGELGVVFDGSE